jgi:hypothetical protein
MSGLPDNKTDAIIQALEQFSAECHSRGECPEDHAAFVMDEVNEATGTFDIHFEPKTEVGAAFVAKIDKIRDATTQ